MNVLRAIFIVGTILTAEGAILIAAEPSKPAAPSGPSVTTQAATSMPAVPTQESIQAQFDAGNYIEGIKSCARLLANRSAAGTFDRHSVLMLEAECQLHMQQNATARTTLETARTEADAAGSLDDAAQAAALSYLISKSTGHTFTPVTGKDRKPLDILNPKARTTAISELFDDTYALSQQKVKMANGKTDYLPVLAVAKDFVYLKGLDRVVHQNTDETDKFAKDSSATAADIIEHTLADYEAKTHLIEDSSNKMVQGETTTFTVHGGSQVQHWERRQGPTSPQMTSLNAMKKACTDMPHNIEILSETFGDPAAFEKPVRFRWWYYERRPDLLTAAEDINQHIEDVLTKDYSR